MGVKIWSEKLDGKMKERQKEGVLHLQIFRISFAARVRCAGAEEGPWDRVA